ncbi:MAG: cupin domain-containing protein [Saprospiraceae bacterium]
MTLSALLASDKAGPVFRPLFKAQNGRLTAIHLRKGEVIKEHKSPVPAMLLVLEGVVVYKQLVDGVEHQLSASEYTEIPPGITHQVTAETDAYCILIQ